MAIRTEINLSLSENSVIIQDSGVVLLLPLLKDWEYLIPAKTISDHLGSY